MFTVLLIIHICGGFTSLLSGLFIVGTKKGDNRHKFVGKIYFWSLFLSALVAIPMTYLHPSFFLFLISIFTIYMLLSGVRYLDKKTPEHTKPLDWILTIIMFLFALAFILIGLNMLLKGKSFGTVLLVFGGIGWLFCYQDWINFTGRSKFQNIYLVTHLQRMTGSYIASSTAFLVVNNAVLPPIVAWLLPTAFLTPLIIIWSNKYQIAKKKQA